MYPSLFHRLVSGLQRLISDIVVRNVQCCMLADWLEDFGTMATSKDEASRGSPMPMGRVGCRASESMHTGLEQLTQEAAQLASASADIVIGLHYARQGQDPPSMVLEGVKRGATFIDQALRGGAPFSTRGASYGAFPGTLEPLYLASDVYLDVSPSARRDESHFFTYLEGLHRTLVELQHPPVKFEGKESELDQAARFFKALGDLYRTRATALSRGERARDYFSPPELDRA